MSPIKAIKYYFIIMWSTLLNKTVVDFFGSTYIVSGNVVTKLGDTK